MGEAIELINNPSQAVGVRFPQQVVDFLLDFVGLHPFYLQVATYHAFELATRGQDFDEQSKRSLEERILSDLADHFAYHLGGLDEEEKRALARLSKVGVSELSFDVGRKLEQRCLVVRQNGGFSCLSHAFEGFVRRKLAVSWEKTVAEGDRRLVTILFADLVDFTPMAEKQRPEEVMRLMRRVTRLFSDPVERHGGVVIQFRGDGILALFGIPVEREDDAARAVRASLDMQRNLEKFNRELMTEQELDLAARVGLNTGVVVVGAMSSDQHVEHTAMGDAVNLAERMQRAARPGGIVISERTYQQVRGLFEMQAMGPIEVKGKTRPVKAYRIVGEK
jgi:class 3 adenylate cyclase